jgi:hypothetical protein
MVVRIRVLKSDGRAIADFQYYVNFGEPREWDSEVNLDVDSL